MVSPLYPFVGRFLELGDARMHYLDEGSGPPVFLLHGNPTWSFFYRDLIPALRNVHRVIAPDHVGCGLSDKPNESKYSYSLERRVSDLNRLIKHIAPTGQVSLVVHDWGGMIGFAWAAAHPERINKLVVMNTAAFGLPAGKRLPWSLKLGRNSWFGPPLIRGMNAFCRGAARWCATRKPLEPEVRRMFLAPYDSWANRIAVDRFVRTIPLSPADPGYDIISATVAALPRLTNRPVLLAWGMKDFVFDGDYFNEWRRRFPAAESIAIQDAGHYLLEDAGEELIPRIAEFLGR